MTAGQTTRQAGRQDRWWAVAAVTIGTFLLVTAEQLPIGLLTSIGSTLLVSEGTAGLTVTVPSMVAAAAALLVPTAVGRLDRRVLLVVLMAAMAIANAISALTTSFPLLVASRVLVGVAIGGFWAVAGGLAMRLVSAEKVTRATALIFGGVGAANVFGVPIGSAIGAVAGWRSAFAVLGGLAVVATITLLALLPSLSADRPLRLRAAAEPLRDAAVRIGILATLLIVTGHFAAYTYISPLLQDVTGLDERLVGPLLFAFGTAGVVGNFVAGATVARHLLATVLAITGALATTLALFPVLGAGATGGIALLVGWGLVFGGVSVSLQTWMIKAAPHAVEAASALWVATFNLSIGLGALLGGAIVDHVALVGTAWMGAIAMLAAGLAAFTVRKRKQLR